MRKAPHQNIGGPRPGKRHGAAAVEFAFLAPVLLVMLGGLWEVGRLVEVEQLVNNAAREAGRQAAAGQQTVSQVQSTASNYLTNAGLNTTGISTSVTNLTSSSRSDPTTCNQLDHWQITVTLPYSNVQWSFFNHLIPTNYNVTATVDWYSMKDLPVTVSTSIPIQ